MSNLILIGAQRRITIAVKQDEAAKKPVIKLTFYPGRVNKCPRHIFNMLMKRKGSPRLDFTTKSPLEEYMDSGILWEVPEETANAIKEKGLPMMSPHGPNSSAYRPLPREPLGQEEDSLRGLAAMNKSIKEQVTIPG